MRALCTIGVLLTGLATAAGASAPVAAADPELAVSMPANLAAASADAAARNEPVPVVDMTTQTAEVVALPDGTFTYTSALNPVRANVDGDWRDIDTVLTEQDGRLQPAVTTVAMSFSPGGNVPLAEVTTPSGSIALTWPTALPVPTVDGDTATYANVLTGVDLKMSATADGYSQVLVVHDAAAAANPALHELQLTTTTDGLTLQPAPDNTVTIVDAAGTAVLQNAAPVMWDSGNDPRVGAPATSDDPGRGAVSPLDVDVDVTSNSPDGQTATVVVTPPTAALVGSEVDYPLYIDPPLQASYGRQHWAEVLSNGWHYYDNASWNPKIGYCGWDGCNGIGTGRAYMQYDLSNLEGLGAIHIADASFYVENIHSAVCDNSQATELYTAGAINAQTAWPGPMGGYLSTSVSTFGDTCGGARNLAFPGYGLIEQYLQDTYNSGNHSVTFGLRASDEGNRNQWKQFSNAPANASTKVNLLEFNFTYQPQLPTNPAVFPNVTCNGDGIVYTSDPTPTFNATVHDGYRDNDSVTQYVTFKVSKFNGRTATFEPGSRIDAGQDLHTTGGNGGNVALTVQTDGNLVLYGRGTAIWSTGTTSGAYLVMQTDGNLVLYNAAGAAIWYTGTYGHPGAYAVVQADGNLIVVAPTGGALWATATRSPVASAYDKSDTPVQAASATAAAWTGSRDLTPGSWLLTVTDETNPGTSLAWKSQTAYFAFDYLAGPATPATISSLDFPAASWGPARGQLHLEAGNASNIVGYAYSWTGASNVPAASTCALPSTPNSTAGNGFIASSSNGTADIPLPSGLAPGVHNLVVASIDKAHNQSAMSDTYTFYSAPDIPNAGTGKYEAEDLAAAGKISQPAGQRGNQLGALPCPGCSGGQAERLGGTGTDASFTFAVTPPVEADYAIGVWALGGPSRGSISGSITTPSKQQTFGTPTAGGASFVELSKDMADYPSSSPTFVPLAGFHLASSETLVTLNATAGNIGLDAIALIPIANVTADNFDAALNNRGIYIAGGLPADIENSPAQWALSRSAMNPAYTAGATVTTSSGVTFKMPVPKTSAPEPQRYDNLLMAGQTVRLHGVKTTSINLLIMSTCGNAPSSPATRFGINYGTTAQPDQDSGQYSSWVTPPVPHWTAGTYNGPVTGQDGKIVLKKATSFTAYTQASNTISGAATIYTLQIAVDPTKPIYSLTMPYYGNSFDCSNPIVHALALSLG